MADLQAWSGFVEVCSVAATAASAGILYFDLVVVEVGVVVVAIVL